MIGVSYSGSQPILGIDVWEHGECTSDMTMQNRQCYERVQELHWHACKPHEQLVRTHASVREIAGFCTAFLHGQPALNLRDGAHSLGILRRLVWSVTPQGELLISLVDFLQRTT